MNILKKRGRPSKADIAAREAAQAPVMNGDTSREPEDVIEEQSSEQALKAAPAESVRLDPNAAGITFDAGDPRVPPVYVEEKTPAGVIVITKTPDLDRAQAYAMRVWSGQTAEMKRAERIRRCEAALQGQGLPTEGVKYPGAGENAEIPAPFDPKAQQSPAQALAMRIWAGQSTDVHRPERIARIERALKEQGLSIEGIRYPASVDRYDDADDEPVVWRMKMPGAEGIV
jgi:hypothetical protein